MEYVVSGVVMLGVLGAVSAPAAPIAQRADVKLTLENGSALQKAFFGHLWREKRRRECYHGGYRHGCGSHRRYYGCNPHRWWGCRRRQY
jgi:hypothetical protein